MGLCFSLSTRKERIVPMGEKSQNYDTWAPGPYVASRILPIDIREAPRPAKPHL